MPGGGSMLLLRPLLLLLLLTLATIERTMGLSLADDHHHEHAGEADTREQCDNVGELRVAQCLKPMLDYAAQLQAETGGSAVGLPLQGDDMFKRLCAVYAAFQACAGEIDCSSMSVRAVDASYGYMCGDGYAAFEQHAPCFGKVESEPDYLTCKKDATGAIAKLGAGGGTTQTPANDAAYLASLCTVMRRYLRCSHPVIDRHCGADAWQLVSTVTRNSLGVTMPDCEMTQALL